MSQKVRGQFLGGEGRAALGGCPGVGSQAAFDGVVAEASASAGRKQRVVAETAAFVHPDAQHGDGGGGDGNGPLFSAFLGAGNERVGAEVDVAAVEPGAEVDVAAVEPGAEVDVAAVETGAEVDVAAVEPDELGEPQSGLDRQQDEGPVTSAFPADDVGGGEEGIDLGGGEEGDDLLS